MPPRIRCSRIPSIREFARPSPQLFFPRSIRHPWSGHLHLQLRSLAILAPFRPSTGPDKISQPRIAQVVRHFSTTSSSASKRSLPDTNMASKYTVRKIGAPNVSSYSPSGLPMMRENDTDILPHRPSSTESTSSRMVSQSPPSMTFLCTPTRSRPSSTWSSRYAYLDLNIQKAGSRRGHYTI